MCSYNKLNGTYACGNRETLIHILREEAGFKGFVTSDWGATHAASFINNGLDMEMPFPIAFAGLSAAVQASVAEGRALGVGSTPMFFVNGSPLVGAQPVETFREAINESLQRSGR